MDQSPPSLLPASGTISLVGAGPGDPDLLTVRAVRALEAATVIVHDRLVDPAVLDLAAPDARRIFVGKMRSRHALPQERINALLVELAQAGHRVVRLKGGDPFIFGRGGEEAEAARAAGIPVEIIPGVTAALGAAAATGIPLTHRDASSAVTFVTGQCKVGQVQDWSGLAGPGRTLVVYMGLTQSASISQSLIDQGVAAELPVAVIENATRADQRLFLTSVGEMAQIIRREAVASPALLIIGAVAARAAVEPETLAPFTLLAAE